MRWLATSPRLTHATPITHAADYCALRSNGAFQLADVYPASHGPFSSGDIYNVEPAELGFYCLSSKRTANDSLHDCPMRQAVARRHAEMLTSAGFDYVAVDITNWPQVNQATDIAVLRPLENLFEGQTLN